MRCRPERVCTSYEKLSDGLKPVQLQHTITVGAECVVCGGLGKTAKGEGHAVLCYLFREQNVVVKVAMSELVDVELLQKRGEQARAMASVFCVFSSQCLAGCARVVAGDDPRSVFVRLRDSGTVGDALCDGVSRAVFAFAMVRLNVLRSVYSSLLLKLMDDDGSHSSVKRTCLFSVMSSSLNTDCKIRRLAGARPDVVCCTPSASMRLRRARACQRANAQQMHLGEPHRNSLGMPSTDESTKSDNLRSGDK